MFAVDINRAYHQEHVDSQIFRCLEKSALPLLTSLSIEGLDVDIAEGCLPTSLTRICIMNSETIGEDGYAPFKHLTNLRTLRYTFHRR